MGLTPVPCDRPAATAPSCVAGPRSAERHGVDSSPACASAPVDADATAVAADRDSRRPAPRCVESGSPALIATTAAHLADRFSAYELAWCECRRDLRPTIQTPAHAANAQTSASVRWTPSPPAPVGFVASAPDRTAQPARDALGAVRSLHPCLCPRKQFAGSPDDNHNL